VKRTASIATDALRCAQHILQALALGNTMGQVYPFPMLDCTFCKARPLRLEFAGALYHVAALGHGREGLYFGDGNRSLFLDVLSGVYSRLNLFQNSGQARRKT